MVDEGAIRDRRSNDGYAQECRECCEELRSEGSGSGAMKEVQAATEERGGSVHSPDDAAAVGAAVP
jgi:hypothetical protein